MGTAEILVSSLRPSRVVIMARIEATEEGATPRPGQGRKCQGVKVLVEAWVVVEVATLQEEGATQSSVFSPR